jgi:trehalose synthase
MRVHLEAYREIVGDNIIDSVYEAAYPIKDRHIVHVNSTYQGGGVAELLNTLVLLMNDIGVDTGWRILHGSPDFFNITKKFHNTLQGSEINLTDKKKRIYEEMNENFSRFTHLDHDLVFIHDPQPLPLIQYYEKNQPWVWRLHIDLSKLNESGQHLFSYLKSFIMRYDAMIVSMESYKKDIPLRQQIIQPSIDPLSAKNEKLSANTIDRYLRKFGIDRDKPLITQVSRFDRFKDPEGVIRVYKKVKEKVDCRLVLIGSMAIDDPESEEIYRRMLRDYGQDPDIVLISATNDILVNALQGESACVIQKSIREGFALTVSEALWKGTPVVGSNVGGIPAQIADGKNGFLVNPTDYEECADRVVRILKDEELAARMGEAGHDVVKERFLVTRHLLEYVRLFNSLFSKTP